MKRTLFSLLVTGAFCAVSQPAHAGDLKLAETPDIIRVTLRG